MRISYYSKFVGGMATHMNNLSSHFNSKLIIPRGASFIRTHYIIDTQWKMIKKEIENCDIFHIHHPATSSELLIPWMIKNIKNRVCIVSTFHTPVGDSKYSSICKTYVKLIAKIYSDISAKFIVVGKKQKEIIEDLVGDKVVLINNGVDTKKFRKKRSRRFFKEFTVGFLGRLDPEKNIFSLIKACRNNINLVIGGTGVYYRKIKEMENGKLKVLGFVENPVEFYNSIDVFVLPSYLEGLPYTVLEAMACEKPVIVSNFGGEEENLKNCGLVCGTKAEKIREAILEIKKKDLEKLGKNARKIVERKYNLKDQIEKHRKLYNSVLKAT